MQCPASPLYSDAGLDYPSTPQRRGTSKIDYSKYKTKMCRNYLLGLPCPFEERCAFSHGRRADEVHSSRSAIAVVSAKTSRRHARHAAPRHEAISMTSSDTAASATDTSSCDGNSDTYTSALPPPPYEAAVQDEYVVVQEEFAPPAYPTRFRYDPYSFAGVLYEA